MKNKTYLFEKMPVWKAVAALAVPSILSQFVTMIYNLADTFYIGQTGNPDMVAAISLSFGAFMVLTAFGNLFGIGGGSLVSRLLGEKKGAEAKHASAFSFYGIILSVLFYSVFLYVFMDPVLTLLGASPATIGFGRDYLFWTTVVGGVPTAVGIVFGHLLRSEGSAKLSSIGIAVGGLLNIVLDPIFIFTLDMGVAGAAIATMLSNVIAVLYYLIVLRAIRHKTVLSIRLSDLRLNRRLTRQVFSVGLPAALASLLAVVANSALFKLLSGYGDTPIAAMGIAKRIDTIPLNVSMGLAQGVLPLVAYNYAAKNYDRMKAISSFARLAGALFALLCIFVFQFLATPLVRLFIPDPETIRIGAQFLRVACLGTVPMVLFFLLNTTFQAMGKGKQSFLLVVARQGFINLPILFALNAIVGMDGLVWTQPIADTIAFLIALVLFEKIVSRLKEEQAGEPPFVAGMPI